MTDDAIPEPIPGEVIELAAHRRQAVPVVRDPLTSASRRVIDDLIGDIVATLGGDRDIKSYELTTEAGLCRLTLDVTFDVASLNRFAATLASLGKDDDRG